MRVFLVVFLMSVGVYAEVLGIPTPEREQGRFTHKAGPKDMMIESASLTPNGQSFYTLKVKKLIFWQLSPVKKIHTINLEKVLKDKAYDIGITSNGKRMFLSSNEELILFDLKSEKVLKKIKLKSSWGIVDGSDFLTLHNRELKRFSSQDLKLLKRRMIPCPDKSKPCENRSFMFFKSKDYLVHNSYGDLSLYDFKTLNLIGTEDISTKGPFVRLSINHKLLLHMYVYIDMNKGELRRYFYGFDRPGFSFREAKKKMWPELTISYQTPISFKTVSHVNGISLVQYAGRVIKKQMGYVMYGFFNTKTEKKLASLFLYPDGEWIVLQPDSYFNCSKGARKHLLMRLPTKEKKYAPINDKTYQKYKKIININRN